MFIIRMMRKKIVYSLLLIPFAGLFTSCDEGDDIWSSAAKLEMIEGFDLVSDGADTISLDFANGDVLTFKGEWNVETSWEIEIKGNVSQKTEKITGTSKSLKDVVWAGNSSETGEKYFPSDVLKKKFNIDLFGKSEEDSGEDSFKDGESCTITLTFTDFEGVDTSKATLKIAAAVDETFTSKDFCMVANWDNVEQLYTNNSPSKIVTSSTNMDVVPEGKKYCILEGTDTGGKWYVDGMGFTFQQVNNWAAGFYPITLADTATTYINLFMYGYPEYCERTTLMIMLVNADNDIECELQGDRISVGEGWHGISIPISRFASKNKNFDFDAIDKISISVFSNGEACDVKTAIDYVVITKKRPLFPVYKN
ncbi:MAG: hypothetical protein J6X18_16765 [Bacteroidales bacterium]|nr:hypothetical protein [Bacteroidales bacterium]